MRYLDKLSEAKVDRGLTRAQKMVAREMRKDDTPDPLAKKNRTKADRERAIDKLKRDRENPGVARAATRAKNRERAKSLRMQRLANKITGDGDPNEKPKKKVEEAQTIPRKEEGGFEKKTTSPDRRVAPTEKALEGEGLSRAEYRKRMMKANKKKKKLKAEAYIQLGDMLAEAMLGEARVNKKIEKSTEAMGRYIRGDRRPDQTPETVRGRALKAGEDLTTGQKRAMDKEALALRAKDKRKRVAGKLRKSAEDEYRSAEVGEASGESPKSVKKKSARAHKRMKTAQDIESKS